MSEPHRHSWQHLTGTKFECRYRECGIVSDLETITANVKAKAELDTKVSVLAKLLFAGDLRKSAHEREYAWVKAHTPDGTVIEPKDNQESLLPS